MSSHHLLGVPVPNALRLKQLRSAKQRQRDRDKANGFSLYQLKLPARLVEKLKAGMKDETFVTRLFVFVDKEIVDVREYSTLKLLCWNRNQLFISRKEAFQIYEGNWRHVVENKMDQHELDLLATLKNEFGRGVING
jgi:hypothetical protein